MVYTLKWIGESRDKPKQRIFLSHLFHSVGNFQIIENRLTPDWNVGRSCYTKRKITPKEPHREEFIVLAMRQLQIDGYSKIPPNFMETMTKRFYANKNAIGRRSWRSTRQNASSRIKISRGSSKSAWLTLTASSKFSCSRSISSNS